MTISLLKSATDLSGLPCFYPMDTRQRFQQNLELQPRSWPWRTRSIHYTLNSQGYRSPEFDQVDWAASIVCFGCSATFGIGVDHDQTWPYYLEQILGCAVINLGQAGSSVEFNAANSQRLWQQGVRPRAVINYWPEVDRCCDWLSAQHVRHRGVWSLDDAALDQNLRERILDHQGNLDSARRAIADLPWSCPVFNWTWARDLDSAEYFRTVLDRSRDLMHMGPRSNFLLAQRIAAGLQGL